MAKQSIESMYDIMSKMREKMEDLLQDAQNLNESANTYGGEISRVISEQLTKYYAPSIKKLLDGTDTPGSIIGLVNFLDSVPLSFTRINPSIEDMAPRTPDNPQFDMPATLGNDLDNIPQNASFNSIAPTSENEPMAFEGEPPMAPASNETEIPSTENLDDDMIMESSEKKNDKKLIREATKYLVVRSSNVGSSLGDISKLEDSIVGEFDTEEAAAAKAKSLNETILPAEKDLLGTKYSVVEKKDTVEDTEEKK